MPVKLEEVLAALSGPTIPLAGAEDRVPSGPSLI